jgi:hypothetical protein
MGNPAEGKRSITRIESILRQALEICQQKKLDFLKKITPDLSDTIRPSQPPGGTRHVTIFVSIAAA